MKTLSISWFLAFSSACFVNSCSDLIVLKCSDGNPVTVVKDVNKAYPVYGVTYDLGVKATLAEIASLLNDASLDVGFKTQITKFRDDLNQESSRYQDKLKLALMGLQTAPCEAKNREEFWSIMKQIDAQTSKLSEVESQLKLVTLQRKSLPDASNKVTIPTDFLASYFKLK